MNYYDENYSHSDFTKFCSVELVTKFISCGTSDYITHLTEQLYIVFYGSSEIRGIVEINFCKALKLIDKLLTECDWEVNYMWYENEDSILKKEKDDFVCKLVCGKNKLYLILHNKKDRVDTHTVDTIDIDMFSKMHVIELCNYINKRIDYHIHFHQMTVKMNEDEIPEPPKEEKRVNNRSSSEKKI